MNKHLIIVGSILLLIPLLFGSTFALSKTTSDGKFTVLLNTELDTFADKIKFHPNGSLIVTPKDPITPGVIGKGSLDYVFNITLDDLNISIYLYEENETYNFFYLNTSIYNQTKITASFDWKIHTIFEDTDYNFKSQLQQKDIGNVFVLAIPKRIKDFIIKVGESSTTIEASASSVATAYGSEAAFCIGHTGRRHTGFEGEGSDAWTGYSDAPDTSWTTQEILATTALYPIMLCPNSSAKNDAEVLFLIGGDPYNASTQDDGVSWTTLSAWHTSFTYTHFACDVNSTGQKVCCGIDSGDDLHFFADGNIVGDISTADSDHCAITVDENDNIFIVVTDTGADDMDIMSSLDGFSTRFVMAQPTGAVSAQLHSSVSVSVQDGRILAVGIFAADLWTVNGSVADWNGGASAFDAAEIDADDSYSPDVSINSAGFANILYQTGTGNAGSIVKANSTGIDFTSWAVRQTVVANAGFSNIADSSFNSNNNLGTDMEFVYTDTNDNVVWESVEVAGFKAPTVTNLATFDNGTLTAESNFLAGDFVFINSTIIDADGDFNSANISIKNSTGELKIKNQTMLGPSGPTSDSFNISFEILSTDTDSGTWTADVWAIDNLGQESVTSVNFELILPGELAVEISFPTNETVVAQGDSFEIRAKVTCRLSDCGIVAGFIRFNETGSEPNVQINETLTGHEEPFYYYPKGKGDWVLYENFSNENVTRWIRHNVTNGDFNDVTNCSMGFDPDYGNVAVGNSTNNGDTLDVGCGWITNETAPEAPDMRGVGGIKMSMESNHISLGGEGRQSPAYTVFFCNPGTERQGDVLAQVGNCTPQTFGGSTEVKNACPAVDGRGYGNVWGSADCPVDLAELEIFRTDMTINANWWTTWDGAAMWRTESVNPGISPPEPYEKWLLNFFVYDKNNVGAAQDSDIEGALYNISFRFNQSITDRNLSVNDSFEIIWLVNATGATTTKWNLHAYFNSSSLGEILITPNSTHERSVCIDSCPGAAADTCSCPGSGDWFVNCNDNCVIGSECDVQNNNLNLNDTGSFSIESAIKNVKNLFKAVTCKLTIKKDGGNITFQDQ